MKYLVSLIFHDYEGDFCEHHLITDDIEIAKKYCEEPIRLITYTKAINYSWSIETLPETPDEAVPQYEDIELPVKRKR